VQQRDLFFPEENNKSPLNNLTNKIKNTNRHFVKQMQHLSHKNRKEKQFTKKKQPHLTIRMNN
jgi:hypothetical protein